MFFHTESTHRSQTASTHPGKLGFSTTRTTSTRREMEVDSSGEEESSTEKKDVEHEVTKSHQVELDPRGFHELAFLGEASSEVECEVEEWEVGAEFDSYEDIAGDKLRLLDSFSIYYEDGRPAPPQALDSAKERGETIVAFGTLVAPLTNDARMKLIALDSRFKGRVPPCVPKSLDGGAQEPLPWVNAATWSKGASAAPKKPKSRGKGKRPVEEGTLSGRGQHIGYGGSEAADRGPAQQHNKRVCTGDVRKDSEGVENGTGTHPAAVGGSGKKRGASAVDKAPAVGKGANETNQKKLRPPPNFSLAAFSGALNGSEVQGVPSSEYVGASLRRGRDDGLLLYYADKAPRDYPLEYESKVAGAASLDWSKMQKNVKVDAFCMETFKWYGAKVAEVSDDRKRVKVHFNGWKSSFDEWMDWGSFRLAPCGSRSSAKREGSQATSPSKKEANTRCILVPARQTARIRIEKLEDWCIDYSDPSRPVLWIVSKTAWYKVAGYGWWDFVAPHPLYAPIFEPSRMGFVVACLVVRSLQASPLASFAAVGRRVFQLSSGMFEARNIVEHYEIVKPTIEGMGVIKTKKKPDNGEGSGAEDSNGSPSSTPNGDGRPDSVDAKVTPFLKELKIKAEEWETNGRSFTRRIPERHALPAPPVPALPKANTGERRSPNPLPGETHSAHGVAPVLSGNLRSTDAGAKAKGASRGSKAGAGGPPNRGGRRAGGRGVEPKHGDTLKPDGRAPKAGRGDPKTGNGFRKADVKATGEGSKYDEGRSKTAGRDTKADAGRAKLPAPNFELLGGGSTTVSDVAPEAVSASFKSFSEMHKARASTSMQSAGGTSIAKANSSAFKAKKSVSKVGVEGLNPGVKSLKTGRKNPKLGSGGHTVSSGAFEGLKGNPSGMQTMGEASKGAGAHCKVDGQDSKSGGRRLSKAGGGASKASGGVPKVRGGGFTKAGHGNHPAGAEKAHVFGSLTTSTGSFGSVQAADTSGDSKAVGFLAKASKKVRPGHTPLDRTEVRQKEQREKAEKAERARKEKAVKAAQAAREKQEREDRLKQEKEEEKARKMNERREKAKKLQEEKARLHAEKQAERRAAMEQRVEKQRLINEKKARIREEKEREKEAKMEKKRLEKEARDRQRAELQAKEQKRRELEKEKARLAKRYPLPDEELWEEVKQAGKAQGPWPAAGALAIPQGFPASAFGDAVHVWSSLQLFGNLMHLTRFGLYELMSALAHGADASDSKLALAGPAGGGAGANIGSSRTESFQTSSSDPDALLDIIPAPAAFSAPAADNAVKVGNGPDAGMLANIHMRLLDFLAWDRTRALTCSRQGKQDVYWKGLLPSLGGGGGSGSGNGEFGGGMSGEDDEFGGMPETTLPGLRDSRELIQASPHGFPELMRLVESHRHGVFKRVEPRRTAAARGFAGLVSGREEGGDSLGVRPMQARALDPLGEVMRILRYVMRSEDARPFLEKAPDIDVDQEESTSKEGMRDGTSTGKGDIKKELERSCLKQPLDLGTILKRAETGWYDLEPGYQPPVGSKSFGAGHSGVAHDVELIQEGWLHLRGGDSAIYKQAKKVANSFLALYQVHVLVPIENLKVGAASGSGQLEPMEMLRKMECSEYARWSPAEKSRALAMLCDEAMTSTTLSDVFRKIFEAREVVDRKDRELKAAVRQRLREQETRDAQGLQPPTSLNRRGTEAEMVAARIAAEEPHTKITRHLGMLRVRLKPLGTDRNHRRYWLFSQSEDHRIFTELNEEWGCYARISQLKALHKWLDRRGARERVLKAALREHLISNLGVSAEDLDPPSRPSVGRLRMDLDGGMGSGNSSQDYEDDDQQYIGEPAEVAREKERERSAGREALKSCGFFADEQRRVLQRQCSAFALDLPSLRAAGLGFDLKSSVFVMRDIAVCMGPNGLGVQLKIDHGGVTVSSFKALAVGRNSGEEAGIKVADTIVSVENIVAMTPRSLADGLSKSGLSRSGKLVVLKVLTRVPCTDERGEPLSSTMNFTTINIVKGELLDGERKLNNRFVIGGEWGGQTCRDWRLGVSFAGQGIGQAWGHGASLSAEGATSSCSRVGVWGEAVPFPSGEGPTLNQQGVLELGPDTEEHVRQAVEELARRMLQLEASVYKQDTVVDARWGQKGRRRKWRMYVNNAQTAAQLLTAWGAFKESIDWEEVTRCFSEMDRRDFISLLPANLRNTMPEKGDSVVYYGDGHAISVDAETKAGYKMAWGNDAPRPGLIKQYSVKSISYHQGGSHRRAKGAQPYATMELEPLPDPGSFPELGVLPTSEPFGPLNRLLKRAIKAMKETPDVAHFLEPVNKAIYPDYYDVVSHPMDLSKLWRRCSICRYKTVEDFKRDLELVASNCRLYCQDKFPSLPPAAEASVKVGMATLDDPKLAAALTEAIEDGKRLEEVWNKHMLAAISASPELATMPGMRKLARQLGVFNKDDEEEVEDEESDDENHDGQPDTTKIARQVFYDNLIGVEYGTSGADKPSYTRPPKHNEHNPSIEQRGSNPQQIKKSAVNFESSPAATIPFERQHQLPGVVTKTESSCSGSDGLAPMEIEMQDEALAEKTLAFPTPLEPPATSSVPASMDVPHSTMIVKSRETDGVDAGAANEARRSLAHVKKAEGCADAGGVLRVSMRLNNEMPEFVVATSKYDEAVRSEWRSEMRIQMTSPEEKGDSTRVYEGKLVGVKPKDESTGYMTWECLVVEWDDEPNVNTVNPWHVEAVVA